MAELPPELNPDHSGSPYPSSLGGRSMKCFDISVAISADLPTYAGDPPTQIELWQEMAKGALADVRSLSIGTHTGTHVDAPAHFLPGQRTADELELAACIGPAQVVDLTSGGPGSIGCAALVEAVGSDVERLLLKTRNSLLWREPGFRPDHASLTVEAAEWLVGRGVRLVGIDYLSVAPSDDPAPVHRALLGAGVVILEGLDLSEVAAGFYTLICLPLKVRGAEGAPARAVLLA